MPVVLGDVGDEVAAVGDMASAVSTQAVRVGVVGALQHHRMQLHVSRVEVDARHGAVRSERHGNNGVWQRHEPFGVGEQMCLLQLQADVVLHRGKDLHDHSICAMCVVVNTA